MKRFGAFIQGGELIGHNLGFDVAMLKSNAKQNGEDFSYIDKYF